jgi:translation elongation factor EF-G
MNLALRKSTINRTLSPLACGSALYNSASILPILDMVVNFLPNPKERKYQITDEIDICAFIFKVYCYLYALIGKDIWQVRHEKKRGQLNYVRLFRGNIKSDPESGEQKTLLVNANTGYKLEKNLRKIYSFRRTSRRLPDLFTL